MGSSWSGYCNNHVILGAGMEEWSVVFQRNVYRTIFAVETQITSSLKDANSRRCQQNEIFDRHTVWYIRLIQELIGTCTDFKRT